MNKFKSVILVFLFLFLIYGIPITAFASDLTIIPIESIDWGDSTLLESNDEYLLIDVTSGKSNDVLDFLESNEVSKFDIYLSHYHYDHYGAYNEQTTIENKKMNLIEYMIRKYDIGKLYLPDDSIIKNSPSELEIKNNLVSVANEFGVEVITLTKGSKFTLGNTTAEVLYMNKETDISAAINNSSLVTMFTSGKIKFLTSGDIQEYTENKILSEGIDVSADIYKLSHHGLQYGTSIANSKQFIDAVKPKYSYFQFNFKENDYNNGYDKVETTINNLSSYSNVYNTTQNGNIAFVIEDDIITPIVEKNSKSITINYIDEQTNDILDTQVYEFNYEIDGNSIKYHLYDYERNFKNYTMTSDYSKIQTSGTLNENTIYNLYYKKTNQSAWYEFVDYIKNTEIPEDENISKENIFITSDDKSLTIKVVEKDKTYQTKYTYENGILTYVQRGNKRIDYYYNSLIIEYLIQKYDYNSEKFYNYIYGNENLTIDKNGIEYTFGELYSDEEIEQMIKEWEEYYNSLPKEEKEQMQGAGVGNVLIFTNLKIDLKNGLKTYDESLIPYYFVLEEENQKYKIGTSKLLKFEIFAEFDLFDSVYIDGKKVDKSNYTASEGSTIIILKQEYLDKLKEGTHELKVTFTDGEFAQTNFIVEKNVKNPETGIYYSYGALVLIIMLGLVTYLFIRKCSKFPKHN